MQCYDVYVTQSTTVPYWYVEYKTETSESGISINQSLSSAFAAAKRIVKYRHFPPLIVLKTTKDREIIDIRDDVEILQAILTYS
jgi:hypothetical protein